jgi:hypothetical protein
MQEKEPQEELQEEDIHEEQPPEEPQEENTHEEELPEESSARQTSPQLLHYTRRQPRDQPVSQAALSHTVSTPHPKLRRKRKELGRKEIPPSRKTPRIAAEGAESINNTITPTVRGRADILSSPTSFLKELVIISQEMAQPDEIFKIFSRQCTREKGEHVLSLTRFFFTPKAFDQLSEACTITRQKDNGISSDSLENLEQTMQTLDKLDFATSLNRILRRFHLARLLDRRVRQEDHHKFQRPQRTTRLLKYGQERIELLSRSLDENNPVVKQGTKLSQSGRADTNVWMLLWLNCSLIYPSQ